MDDPMIRPRLGRIKGTRPLGALDPKPGPPLFLCARISHPKFDCLCELVYSVQHATVQNLKFPDGAVAVAEDLIALGCGLLLVSQF
jgi:hypothetical protein